MMTHYNSICSVELSHVEKLVILLLMPWPKLPFNWFRLIAIVSRYTSTLVQVMAWCRAYLVLQSIWHGHNVAYFNNLGHFSVFFVFFSAVVNQHLTCVNECTFMSVCIAYYVNTYMYKCFFFMKECQSIHLYIFRTPFHWWWPISICSAVVQLKVYVKVQLTSGLFFFFFFLMNCCVVKRYSHHVADTGRPFSWILYFFTFCHS